MFKITNKAIIITNLHNWHDFIVANKTKLEKFLHKNKKYTNVDITVEEPIKGATFVSFKSPDLYFREQYVQLFGEIGKFIKSKTYEGIA